MLEFTRLRLNPIAVRTEPFRQFLTSNNQYRQIELPGRTVTERGEIDVGSHLLFDDSANRDSATVFGSS